MFFITKKRFEEEIAYIKNDLKKIFFESNLQEKKLNKMIQKPIYVSCEVCGCLLNPENAISGESEIRTKRDIANFSMMEIEYIYNPYYCKIHAPKLNSKEKTK